MKKVIVFGLIFFAGTFLFAGVEDLGLLGGQTVNGALSGQDLEQLNEMDKHLKKNNPQHHNKLVAGLLGGALWCEQQKFSYHPEKKGVASTEFNTDGTVLLFHFKNGDLLEHHKSTGAIIDFGVRAFSFNSKNNKFVCGYENSRFSLYKLHINGLSKHLLKTFDFRSPLSESPYCIKKTETPITAVAFSNDGNRLAVSSDNEKIKIYDLALTQKEQIGFPTEVLSHMKGVSQFVLNNEGTMLATIHAQTAVEFYDVKKKKQYPRYGHHFSTIHYNDDDRIDKIKSDFTGNNIVIIRNCIRQVSPFYQVIFFDLRQFYSQYSSGIQKIFMNFDEEVSGVTFCEEWKTMAVAAGKSVLFYNLKNGPQSDLKPFRTVTLKKRPTSIDMSQNGQHCAISHGDNVTLLVATGYGLAEIKQGAEDQISLAKAVEIYKKGIN